MIRVICTGKGSHREIHIQPFDYGPYRIERKALNVSPWSTDSDWREGTDKQPLAALYTFTCRRCSPVRETQMKKATLKTALSGLRAAGQTTLDISALPF